MAYRGQGREVQEVMGQAVSLICRHLQRRSRIQGRQVTVRIEGWVTGFDEYMSLVLDDAEEIHCKTESRKQLDGIVLKGDNITRLPSVSSWK
ncbi:small nuclear ribonucleoprotein E-like [Ctenodactylus gundi]